VGEDQIVAGEAMKSIAAAKIVGGGGAQMRGEKRKKKGLPRKSLTAVSDRMFYGIVGGERTDIWRVWGLTTPATFRGNSEKVNGFFECSRTAGLGDESSKQEGI